MTLTEGIHEIDEATYHADPCPQPSLSSSIAKVLLGQSPRHAWVAHPRLNKNHEPEESGTFDIGSAAHRVVLGKGADLAVIEADSYRTKAAGEARDKARAEGKIPVLTQHFESIVAMHAACRAQLSAHEEAAGAFTKGQPEVTLIWREGEIWCRCRLDWLPHDRRFFDDYKTTTDASPEAVVNRVFGNGYDVQAAFYRRGIRKILAVPDPKFRFIVQEKTAPYAMTVAALTPAALDMADRKVEAALQLWAWCLKRNEWPGYPGRTVYVEPPLWHERQWLEREERESEDKTWKDRMLKWQAPV